MSAKKDNQGDAMISLKLIIFCLLYGHYNLASLFSTEPDSAQHSGNVGSYEKTYIWGGYKKKSWYVLTFPKDGYSYRMSFKRTSQKYIFIFGFRRNSRMENIQDEDLIRVKELLRHTGEFIAYFELAETKMMEWREEMEQQAARLFQQTQALHNELASAQELFSQAGTSRFRVITERALSQGETHLQSIERSCSKFTQNFTQQQEELELLTEKCLTKIENHSSQATQCIADELSKYDALQFHRIAIESCDHVERAANNAVSKSNKLLSMFHLRFNLFAIFITIITAFVIVLYLSGELPWEIHHQAVSEREAGKVLLQAWPNLSMEEKTKILNDEGS